MAVDRETTDAVWTAALAHGGGWSDGALRAIFLDRSRAVLLTVGFDEGTGSVDELFLRHLVATVTDLALAGVVFAVLRTDGRPTRADRRLSRELRQRLADGSTQLLDVIVVNKETGWSAVQSKAFSSAAARCPDRTAPSM